MRVAIGVSIVVLCCSRVTVARPAKSALIIRWHPPSQAAWSARQDGLAVTMSTTRLPVHEYAMAEQEDGIT